MCRRDALQPAAVVDAPPDEEQVLSNSRPSSASLRRDSRNRAQEPAKPSIREPGTNLDRGRDQ
jgi:hypothetical protein